MWEVRVTPAGDFDNHAFKSNHFEVRPLSAALGAEVVGVRLPDMSDEAFEQFKQALYRHKMLYLRDQHLTHAEHEEFGARLGPFAVDAYTQGVPGHREVHPIIKEADTKSASLFGRGWPPAPNSRRYFPPVRTSMSHDSSDTAVTDFGIHHCRNSSGRLQASNTVPGGASNTRVTTSSRSPLRSTTVRFCAAA